MAMYFRGSGEILHRGCGDSATTRTAIRYKNGHVWPRLNTQYRSPKLASGSLNLVQHQPQRIMANFIELTTGQGPRAINIEHIRSFSAAAQGTRITYHGNGEEDVQETYDVVRTMLSVTQAPRPAVEEPLSRFEVSSVDVLAKA